MNYRIELKWGVLFIVILLIWTFLEKSVGLHSQYISLQQVFSSLVIIPYFIIYTLALKDKKENYYGGSMTYMEAFKTGFYITLIIAVLSPISQFINTDIISREYFTNAIRFNVKSGKMTQQEAVQFFSLANYMIFSFIGVLVIGTIVTSIVSAFVKSKKRNYR